MRASRSRGTVRARSASSAARPAKPRLRRPGPAETALLELARSLGAVSLALPDTGALAAALTLLERAFGPGAPLPRQLAQAWLRVRDDKTGALALGWAREQVRHALAEIVLREWRPASGVADTAAWLLLAVAEAEAHEPGGTVGDRLRTFCEFLRRATRRG